MEREAAALWTNMESGPWVGWRRPAESTLRVGETEAGREVGRKTRKG